MMQAGRNSVTSVKERLCKNPTDIANNTFHFLNGLTNDELKVENQRKNIHYHLGNEFHV